MPTAAHRPHHHRLIICCLGALAIAFAAPWLMAQAAPRATPETQQPLTATPAQAQAQPSAPNSLMPTSDAGLDLSTGQLPTLLELFMTSPIINGIIAGLSVLALLLFIYFLLTINSSALAPASFVDDVNKLVLSGRYDEAASLCRTHRKLFAASIIQRCLENTGKGHSVILDMLDSEGRRRADVLWNRISYLADVSNVAPMLGLLGTVMGMLKAFFLLEHQAGNVMAGALSRGVGQAMATTFFGLIVAILALVFYSIIKSRATRALADVEQVTHSIVDHIKRGQA